MTVPSTERLIARIEGAIGWIVFNNPARMNAVSIDMWEALPHIIDRFERDPAVRTIVVRGTGERAFISGADISQFEQERSSPESVRRFDRVLEEARMRLRSAGKPTVAMIYGYCIGGGLAVALDCDLRFAADTARFSIPAARLGVGYGWDGVKELVDLIGQAYAKEIFLTARQFDAAEARGMGIVNRVVSAAELDDHVRSACARIAENAPLSIRASKGTIAAIGAPGEQIDRERCLQLEARCFASGDYTEGRRAFMEKRRPVFTGE